MPRSSSQRSVRREPKRRVTLRGAMKLTPKLFFSLTAFAAALALDQLSKLWIVKSFRYGERVVVVPGVLDLTHLRNPGGAFSLLASAPAVPRMAFFVVATGVAIALLVLFLRRLEPGARLAGLALGLILAGAVGNLADRLVYGTVIDMIDVHLGPHYTWPTFNIADSVIVVGVGVLLLETLLGGAREDSDLREQASERPAEGASSAER